MKQVVLWSALLLVLVGTTHGVAAQTISPSLAWTAPTTLETGQPIPATDPLQGYHFFVGASATTLVKSTFVAPATATSVPLSSIGLTAGKCVAMTAFNTSGDSKLTPVLCYQPIGAPTTVHFDITISFP